MLFQNSKAWRSKTCLLPALEDIPISYVQANVAINRAVNSYHYSSFVFSILMGLSFSVSDPIGNSRTFILDTPLQWINLLLSINVS